MLFRILIFCCLLFCLSAGCTGVSQRTVQNPEADNRRVWHLLGCGYEVQQEIYCTQGSLSMDDEGNVSSGSLLNIGYDTEKIIGGSMHFAQGGTVTGNLLLFVRDINSKAEYSIQRGQMSDAKDMVVYAGKFHKPRHGIGFLLKNDRVFSQSELEGEWIIPLERRLYDMSIDKDGVVQQCALMDHSGDDMACEGKIEINPDGAVTGHIKNLNDKPFTLSFKGYMKNDGQLIVFTGAVSTRFEGSGSIAIKKTAQCHEPDIQGKWKYFWASDKEIFHGELSIDMQGKVAQGIWETVDGNSGTFSGGALSVTEGGKIAGLLHTSSGRDYFIQGGQIASGCNFAVGLDKSDSGKGLGIVIFVKTPSKQ